MNFDETCVRKTDWIKWRCSSSSKLGQSLVSLMLVYHAFWNEIKTREINYGQTKAATHTLVLNLHAQEVTESSGASRLSESLQTWKLNISPWNLIILMKHIVRRGCGLRARARQPPRDDESVFRSQKLQCLYIRSLPESKERVRAQDRYNLRRVSANFAHTRASAQEWFSTCSPPKSGLFALFLGQDAKPCLIFLQQLRGGKWCSALAQRN